MVHKKHKPIIVAKWRRNQSERIRITLEYSRGAMSLIFARGGQITPARSTPVDTA